MKKKKIANNIYFTKYIIPSYLPANGQYTGLTTKIDEHDVGNQHQVES